MIVIDHSKLQEVIAAYKKYFPTHIGDEIYKWKAVKQFQDKWDIDAPDFIQMFWDATSLFDNLLASMNHYPRGMVKEMAESEPETVRQMFRDLFDETQPLADRVNHFRAESDRIREQYWPDKMHYQDFNSMSIYLWARYPDKYYEFMSTKFRLNVALGQRLTFIVPENKRKKSSHISLFYEVGTCDLYIRSMFQSSDVKLKDILGFSIGLKFHTL